MSEAPEPIPLADQPASPLPSRPPEFGIPLEIRIVLLTGFIIVVAMAVVTWVSVATAEQAILDEWRLRGRMAKETIEAICQPIWRQLGTRSVRDVVMARFAEIDSSSPPIETRAKGETLLVQSWQETIESKITQLCRAGYGFTEIFVYDTGMDGRLGLLAPLSERASLHEPTESDREAFDRERVSSFTRHDARGHRLVQSYPLYDGNGDMRGTVSLTMSLDKVDEVLAAARANIIQWTLMVAIAAAAILLIYFHGTVSKPVRALVTLVERIRQGDLSARSHLHGTAEIGWLARNFDLMVKSIEASEGENRTLLKQVRDFNEVLQEQVRVATQRLQETNETVMHLQRDMSRQERLASLGQLATTLAHEVGTPLNALSGHLELLREDPALSEASRSRLTVMEAQVDRLTAIIRNVLQTMRMPEPQFQTIDVNRLIRDLFKFVTPTLRFKGIELEVAEYPELQSVLADPQQLQQVVMNLVSNAIDAMPSGGKLAVTTGYLPLGAGSIREPAVVIRITDTGPGIPADQMARLFTPYFTTKSLGFGSGLGLVISRQILRGHGGDISAESEAGKGTSFSLILPCSPALDASARGKTPQAADGKVSRTS
ncbi:MAG: ATP-binding protein [Planctomycetota bacterium]